jgi:hypothetical protein
LPEKGINHLLARQGKELRFNVIVFKTMVNIVIEFGTTRDHEPLSKKLCGKKNVS